MKCCGRVDRTITCLDVFLVASTNIKVNSQTIISLMFHTSLTTAVPKYWLQCRRDLFTKGWICVALVMNQSHPDSAWKRSHIFLGIRLVCVCVCVCVCACVCLCVYACSFHTIKTHLGQVLLLKVWYYLNVMNIPRQHNWMWCKTDNTLQVSII